MIISDYNYNIVIFIIIISLILLNIIQLIYHQNIYNNEDNIQNDIHMNISNQKAELLYYKKCRKNFTFEKIPKICYQTWKTYELPDKINNLIKKNKKINPDIEFKLYNNKDCEDFIKNNFDERVFSAYNKININVVKADFWRYCILYINGGIYLDIKSSINRKLFNNIIKDDDICLLDLKRNTFESYRYNNILSPSREQWLLIFCKGHPYLKTMIDILVHNILDKNISIPCYNTSSNDKKQQILRLSGPDAFTAAINLYITHSCLLHRDIDYNLFAILYPISNSRSIMYNNSFKHYSEEKAEIIL